MSVFIRPSPVVPPQLTGEFSNPSHVGVAGNDLDGAMWMTDDHEAHTQAAVRPVPHAGPGLHLLLLREASSSCLGPEDS